MKGLQRLPEVLEDAPSIVADVASKQMRCEIQPTPSARAKKLALQEHLLPSCNPVLVLVFFFELCFPPVPQHRWQAQGWPQPLCPACCTCAMLAHVQGQRKKPSLHPLICCTPWRVNERCLMRTAHSASCWETQPHTGPLPEPLFPVPVPEMLPQTQTGDGQGNKPCPASVFWLPWQYAHPCWSRLGSTEVQKTTRRNVRTWHTVTVTRWGA